MNKDAALNFAESLLAAEGFEIFFNALEKLRKEKLEQFINAILEYIGKGNEEDYLYLRHRIKLSEKEESLLLDAILATITSEEMPKVRKLIVSKLQEELFHSVETGQVGTAEFHQLQNAERQEILRNLKLTDEEISIVISYYFKQPIQDEVLLLSIKRKFSDWETLGLYSATPELSGEELLKTALQKIKIEKKFRKPSDLKRFVEPRIKKTFSKKPEAFTNEEVTNGVSWYIATKEKIADKKSLTDNRSRSRVNVSQREWNAFMIKQFGITTPIFARKYQKTVRDKVRKISK